MKGIIDVTPTHEHPDRRRRRSHPVQRVGIYARVSTNRTAQLHSLAAQVSDLTRRVANHDGWELVDIYMDVDSASGAKTRIEFKRMIEDAQNKKLDIVITKSIQRFGRNTEENLTTMRTLVSCGVVIYFQIEDLWSDSPMAELHVSLLSGIAQADNASHREEQIWGMMKKVKDGTSELYKRACYGYFKNAEGILSIDRNQAAVVKDIFSQYLSGASINGIKRMLEEKHIPSPSGGEKWPVRTIDMMLSNEKYYGSIVLFKTVTINYPYSQRVNNRTGAFADRYCVTNGIDAIIDEETFKKVQEEKARRSSYEEGENGRQRKKTKYSSKKS